MNSISTSAGDPPLPPKATRREWTGLAVLALPCLIYSMDLTVLNLALPAISADLKPSASQLLWMIDIYGFLVAGFLITMGSLGDRIGRRRLLLYGAAAFGAASVIAAFSRSAEMLIAMRAVLGIAGATIAPSTMSLIRNMFHDEHQRQFAIGVWIASYSAGGIIGPMAGGLVLQVLPWGAVFLIAVPVMVMLLLLGPVLLPEYRDPAARGLDLPSVVLSLTAVLVTIYGLKQIAEHGWSIGHAAAIVAGILIGLVFIRRQRRLADPLLDVSLFRQPRFAASISAYGLSCLAMFGVYIFITQYLQGVLGLSPLAAGLATVPWSLAFLVGSLLAPRFARHLPSVTLFVRGLAAAAVGLALLAAVDGPWGLPVLILATVVMSLGLAPVFTLGNDMIITAAPPERAGAASALSETVAEFGGALGIAVLGSLGTAIYRRGLAVSAPPDVPAASLNDALGTLGAAAASSALLPAPVGDALLAAARAAFVDAMQWVALACAAIVVCACLFSVRMLRGDPGRPPDPSPRPATTGPTTC